MTRADFLRHLPAPGASGSTVAAVDIPAVRYRDGESHPDAVPALFEQRWQALGGKVHRARVADLPATVAAIVSGRSPALIADHPLLAGICGELHWPECGLSGAADATIAVVVGAAALAATGSVVLDSRISHGRSAGLLAPEVVFVVRESTVVKSLGDVLRRTAEYWPGGMPSQLVVVSGPSRTADIEHTLTRGVHGPGEVHAILVA